MVAAVVGPTGAFTPNSMRGFVPNAETRRRIDWDAAKTRVLSILIERAKRGEAGLTNKEIRQITRFDRNHAYRLMRELREENPQIQPPGKGKHARYEYRNT